MQELSNKIQPQTEVTTTAVDATSTGVATPVSPPESNMAQEMTAAMADDETRRLRIEHARKITEEISTQVGCEVVLVPVRYMDKCPLIKGHPELRLEANKDEEHLLAFTKPSHCNYAVLCGINDLAVLDFDDDDEAETFVAENSSLRDTLRVKGNRWGHLYVILKGDHPPTCDIRDSSGKVVAELKTTGALAVFRGKHKTKKNYEVVWDNQAAEIDWGDIVWRDGVLVPDSSGIPCDPRLRRIEEEHGPAVISREGSISFNLPCFAAKYADDHQVCFSPSLETFFRYCDATGLWRLKTDLSVNTEISRDLLSFARMYEVPELITRRTAGFLEGLAKLVKGHTEADLGGEAKAGYVHLTNGMLELATGELRDFSPEFYSVNSSPFAYDPDAKCPQFDEMMGRSAPTDDIELLIKLGGMMLGGENFAQKILLITGPGGTGKSVFVDVLTNIVGLDNVAELRTKHLNDRFEISRFIGKTLLMGNDVPGNFLNLAGAQALKKLTGGGHIGAELKNKNGEAQLEGTFSAVITANQTLRVNPDGDQSAWARRLLLVDFPNKVKKPIANYTEKLLQAEAPGIINRFLQGLRDLESDFKEHGGIVLTEAQQERIDKLLKESDSVAAFIIEETAVKKGSDVTTMELLEAYEQYCFFNSWAAQPSHSFQREVAKFVKDVHGIKKSHDIRRETGLCRGFKNLTIVAAAIEGEVK